MARNPRDVETSWRARPCASARRLIGASMLACALAGMLSAALPSAAARPVQVAAVAADDADTCKQASGDVAIAACTRAIASDRYAGHDLARLHYDRAVEYANKGDYDRAIADFSSAIHLDATDADTYNNRGAAYLAKGENDRAFADFSEAIRLHPTDPDYYNNRGSSWQLKGDYDRTIVDYNEAIRLNPKDPCPFYNRGIAWSGKDENDRAIADFNEAIRLNPNYAAAFYRRGIAWTHKGDYDRAIADYSAAIRLNLKKADVFYARGTAWHEGRQRPRHSRPRRGDPPQSEERRCLQQPRHHLAPQGRQRSRH